MRGRRSRLLDSRGTKKLIGRSGDRWRGDLLEESPGSTEARRRITSARGNPRDSATESKPPRVRPGVRVKGCGKSAPRPWRQGWQGKPRLEQDRIGMEVPQGTGAPSRSIRVGRARRSARSVPEEWSLRGLTALDRTRLTGRPIFARFLLWKDAFHSVHHKKTGFR